MQYIVRLGKTIETEDHTTTSIASEAAITLSSNIYRFCHEDKTLSKLNSTQCVRRTCIPYMSITIEKNEKFYTITQKNIHAHRDVGN